MNSRYRKNLPGTALDHFGAQSAVDAIQPEAWRHLPYTARVHAAIGPPAGARARPCAADSVGLEWRARINASVPAISWSTHDVQSSWWPRGRPALSDQSA